MYMLFEVILMRWDKINIIMDDTQTINGLLKYINKYKTAQYLKWYTV